MISTFEQAIRLMPQQSATAAQGGRPVESWVWVMDFHGFSIRDCDPRLAKVRAGAVVVLPAVPAAAAEHVAECFHGRPAGMRRCMCLLFNRVPLSLSCPPEPPPAG